MIFLMENGKNTGWNPVILIFSSLRVEECYFYSLGEKWWPRTPVNHFFLGSGNSIPPPIRENAQLLTRISICYLTWTYCSDGIRKGSLDIKLGSLAARCSSASKPREGTPKGSIISTSDSLKSVSIGLTWATEKNMNNC